MSLSKVAISLTSGVLAFTWLEYGLSGEDRVSNVAFPVLVALLFAYFMAEAVLDVYNYGIDTILVCYCLDKEINKTPEYMKAGEHLQTFVKKNCSKKKAAGESDDEED